MSIMEEAPNILNEKKIRAGGLWGALHELGHNQQAGGWNFPPHTTEATCNLWSVYVNETVLGVPMSHAHSALTPERRKQRIEHYLQKGAPLKIWNVWTALETYLQVLRKYREIEKPPDPKGPTTPSPCLPAEEVGNEI